jgi:hypothetical protein
MNLFQLIALPFIAFLFLRSAFRVMRGRGSRRVTLLEAIIWLSASIAVLQPNLTIQIANLIGIGRGADLVLYLLVLGNLFAWFFFYRKMQKQESEITELVRQFALRDALANESESARNKITDSNGPAI